MPEDKESLIEAQREQLESVTRKADHLANFGTLTSSLSTLAYFIESNFTQKLPKWVQMATLGTLALGIVSSVASFFYRSKAAGQSKALATATAHLREEKNAALALEACEKTAHATTAPPEKSWTGRTDNRAQAQETAL